MGFTSTMQKPQQNIIHVKNIHAAPFPAEL